MPSAADSPVLEPSDDLLEMKGHADGLADRLAEDPLPFTLGIYGGWGEGKTTFAHLVTHHLRRRADWTDLRFVEFSAWPYVTGDAIWRALLESVARVVYGQKEDTGEDELAPKPVGARLRRMLLKPLFPKPDESDGERAYEELMSRLGRATALTARTTRDSEAARHLAVLSAFVLDVAASAAPPLATLRGLFGKGEEAAKAATRNREVQGVEEMRRAVRELFRAAGKPRTVVLIDDLDRCLPEVAFDVLETLKVFLAECTSTGAECLFIIPVDRKILERGLTARLGTDDVPQGAYARRYLEKIIQRGISVSEVRASSPSQLIGCHFPEWVGAADLLNLATQGNPRRLKQQCDLLSLHFKPERRQA